MRITSSMYYKNLYGANNTKLNNELFDVNKQIASGLKIQYAKDDVTVFTKTMRLDNEVTTLGQIKKSTQSGYKVSNQTDEVLNEFETSMNRMRTLLVQAANGVQSDTSFNAISQELRGIEKNFKGLANTSINGQYLFSGSAVDVKPISDDGTYNGNDHSMNAFVGSKNQQQYNLSGSDLFLGEEITRQREITSSVINNDLINGGVITAQSSIRDLMGDKDNDKNTLNKNYFYIRGTKSDGASFKVKKEFDDTAKVSDLLDEIGKAYGNDGYVNVVNVSLNKNGQIVVEDKQKASSKLDFHIVGAVDFAAAGGNDKANVDKIDDLDAGQSDYNQVKNSTSNDLYVKEFMKSNLTSASGAASNIQGIVYDRTQFSKNGSQLTSNAPQILKGTNAFATNATKLLDVASGATLDGKKLELKGTNINGTDFTVQIDLKNSGSTFSVNGGTSQSIFDMGEPTRQAVDSDKMTYRQLMDVMNIVATESTGFLDNTQTGYDDAIAASNTKGNTSLTYDAKLKFTDLTATQTQAKISLYDDNSGDFTKDASILTFNTNNALTIKDPKTDFFKSIDEMISAVEEHKLYPDSSSGDGRNIGIEYAISKMDDLQDHVFRMHSKVGAQSNSLDTSLQRTELLETSTVSLRSSIVDTDLAEASLRLQQLTVNYQAMLSTVGRVSQLSLVNYL